MAILRYPFSSFFSKIGFLDRLIYYLMLKKIRVGYMTDICRRGFAEDNYDKDAIFRQLTGKTS